MKISVAVCIHLRVDICAYLHMCVCAIGQTIVSQSCKKSMKEGNLQSHNFVYRFLNRHHGNRFVGKLFFVAVFGLLALMVTFYTNVGPQVHAASTAPICSGNEQTHTVT